MDGLNALEELLANRWVIKDENKEKYYQIRDNIEEIRKYAIEKLGCQVIVNSSVVKLEKIPAQPEEYMGITDFTSPREYGFLCMMLMFLEDKEAQEQFVLSQITEFIASHMPGERVDWTVYTTRKQLVRVMRYCLDNGMIKVTDGDEDSFALNENVEVLYENTGVSKYFMRNFTKDISQYRTVEDFAASDWVDVNEDRGIARRHRVYKRLLFSPGIYRNGEEDEDFNYLKHYRNRMSEDFEEHLNCRLQVFHNSAFLVMNDGCRMGQAFPENKGLSDLVLLCNGHFAAMVRSGELKPDKYEMVRMDQAAFEEELVKCREKYSKGLLKTYRDKTSTEFAKIAEDAMVQYGFVKRDRAHGQVVLLPLMGRIVGEYPENF